MSRLKTAIKLAITQPRRFVRVIRFRNGPPRYRNLPRLVSKRKPKTIAEIGVWRGDSAKVMIQTALRHNTDVSYWGFDLFSEGITDAILEREVSLDTSPLAMSEVRAKLEGLGAEVHLVAGDSTKTVASTPLPPIDFAFIDGGHSYDTVAADWRNLRPRMSPGAVVVFDDYTNVAAVENEGFGIRTLIEELKLNYKVELRRPTDTFHRPWGPLKTRFAVLRMPGAVSKRDAERTSSSRLGSRT